MIVASDISNLKISAYINGPFVTSVLMIRASKHDLLIAVRLRSSDILDLKIWWHFLTLFSGFAATAKINMCDVWLRVLTGSTC